MAKRGATSELNDRNWDDEEEPEEAGVFKQADKETLQQRVMKKAKRRGLDGESGTAKASAFSGFSGLKSATTKSTPFSGFGLGASSGSSAFSLTSAAAAGGSTASSISKPLNGNNTGKADLEGNSGDWKGSPAYFSFLKALNNSVLAWIKQHVEENPYIILTPVFKDYQKYLEEQEEKHAKSKGVKGSNGSSFNSAFSGTSTSIEAAGIQATESVKSSLFGKTNEDKDKQKGKDSDKILTSSSSSPDEPKGFSFGTTAFSGTGGSSLDSTTTSTTAAASSVNFGKPGFSFAATTSAPPVSSFTFGSSVSATKSSPGFTLGTSTTSSGGTAGFTFGSTTTTTSATSGFSFASAVSQATSSCGATNENDEEEYVPPKPEVKEVKEDDSLYSKRCKLYYQRYDKWVDRGVGNIHLKPVEDNKTQILIRADTNLGNILLNVMLTASMPVSRQGKNNVFIVCVLNPPIGNLADPEADSKPVPMLVRVKTEEDADTLFSKIDERKALLSS